MAASPSLKIKLKLSGPRVVGTSSPQPSSPAASIKSVNKREDSEPSSSTESPRKKAKPNANRNRKPKTEGTPVPDTPITVDDDNTEEAPSQNSRRGGGGGGGGNGAGSGAAGQNTTLISRKDLLKHKDIKVRKWSTKPLVFHTLKGFELQIPTWQSEEKMAINDNTTEPISVAEIDQLFSSTAGEKDFRPFLCTQPGCSKSFTTFDQLQTHETNMHGAKKLVCNIDGCHKSFVTSGQMTKHRKMVHYRAARKAKMEAAAAAEAAAAEADSTKADKDDDMASTPNAINNGDNDSVDIANL
ncbi:uncharacterized protein ATC70_006415 [Mucor velutinosus]|uniref:C2H2-type domain-containing protein n=1 Tax=Mucor velutinosus TaxID=708070 RepID=A0AAN7D3V9_9FUNG|nr:hypothetical protein ATC70_006415 [Mucor velutinosus]